MHHSVKGSLSHSQCFTHKRGIQQLQKGVFQNECLFNYTEEPSGNFTLVIYPPTTVLNLVVNSKDKRQIVFM